MKNIEEVKPVSLLVGRKELARLLSMSLSHLDALEKEGQIGPEAISFGNPKVMGRRKFWQRKEIEEWVAVKCPERAVWRLRPK